MDNNIGKKLDGRYELLELIGVGGMADIYKARDIVEDKIVAAKILKNELAESEDFLRRFRNESKAIALLSHPNIVKIFDVGFTDKVQFIVMEYIDGITLTEYIERQGVLKWRDAIHFATQILKALQHAHDRGIVHRDIKSQNVMLLSDGMIKVMDFGIARFNRETDKTISEKAIGSVHYISPEQARGEATDEKSDIYSVGVMLFEMLTGRKPFDGDNPVSIALMHMQTKPKKPKEINSSIPDGLEEITLKAMQKEAVKRYQTAGEMMNDIEEFKKNPSIVFEYKYFSTDQNAKYFDKPSANSGQLPPQKDLTPPKGLTAGHDDEDDDEDFDDYYDEVVERRSPLLAILFATASVFVIMTAWLIYSIVTGTILEPPDGSGREMRMPMLIGMDYDEARREYPELNFNPTQEYSTDFLSGQIMAQSMAEGRTFRTSQQIGVIISKGPELVELDRFEGGVIHIDEVLARLRNQGFPPPAIRPMEDETIPENFVIRTEPAGGEMIERNTRITIWVSDGNASMPTAVPNFVGQTLVLAESRAKMHDLVLVVEYEHHETVDEGRVISQDIPVETRVDRHSEVTIIVSLGPELERSGSIDFRVQNVTGSFIIRYFVNGIQVGNDSLQSFDINNRILWEFTGTESRVDYAIEVESAATGKVGMFCRFEYDFTSANPNATRKQILLNEGIFTYLSTPDTPFVPPAENGANGEEI